MGFFRHPIVDGSNQGTIVGLAVCEKVCNAHSGVAAGRLTGTVMAHQR